MPVTTPLQIPKEIPQAELQQIPMAVPSQGTGVARPVGGFEDVLGQMVSEVNQRQAVATDKVQGLLSGQEVSLHETMVSMEEASLSFQLMVEVRNKLLESYQELMRMQV
jgi:flagellar hook-basal body complex protein FliE